MDQFRRRQFLVAAGGLLALPFAGAQTSGTRRLGHLFNSPEPSPEEIEKHGLRLALSARLASLGWIAGKNLFHERLYSGGELQRLPTLVAELIRRRVDAIWVPSTAAAVAAARGTKSVPIVLAGASAYPMECGLIQSYARPGTNVTGVAWFQSIEIHEKLAEFVREIVPKAKRLAWIVFPADLITVSGSEFSPKQYYAKAAQALGFDFNYYECRSPLEIEPTFAALRQWGAQAVIIEPAVLSFTEAHRIGGLAKAAGIPAVCGQTQNVVGGGLLGYSPIHKELWVAAASYVDRIFRGGRPSEMPVVMPNKLELSVNLQTARALGITLPRSILLRADRVIE